MIINSIHNISFKKHKRKTSEQKQNIDNKNDKLNKAILDIDRATYSLGTSNWDKIYALDESQKENLVDYLKATCLIKKTYDRNELLNPKKISPIIDEILHYGGILDEKEIEIFKEKTAGAHNPKDVLNTNSILLYGDEDSEGTIIDNLYFIKKLMQKENRYIFASLNPITASKILFNKLLTYEDFNNSLYNLKKDCAINISANEAPFDLPKGEYKEIIVHEYLLGESYPRFDLIDIQEKRKKLKNI